MLKFVSKNALLLGGAAAICVLLVAGINQLTAPEIARQAELEKLRLLQEVLPAGAANADLLHDCVLVAEPAIFGSTPACDSLNCSMVTRLPNMLIISSGPVGFI